jgi:poly(A) polymerase
MAARDGRAQALLAAPGVTPLLARLGGAGHAARIVGGSLRNSLIDAAISDIDIATTRLPEDVMARAASAGWRAVPTGIAHGTVTLLVDGQAFEVTTLREDIATDGRHAVVRFGRDFERDAARRDFTINALSMGLDGVVHDYFDGIADLSARRVRFIGDPDQRLREDYLRGLRFLRFSAEYAEGALDPAGLAAVIRQKAGFAGLSAERIRQEMLKLLVARRAADVIDEAHSAGLVAALLGGEVNPDRFRKAAALDPSRDPVTRLLALAVRSAEDGARLREVLRLSNAESAQLSALLTGERLIAEGATLRHLAYRVPDGLIGLAVLHPEAFGNNPEARHLALAGLRDTPPRFRLSGADVLRRGLQAGPIIGKVLGEAERLWINDDLPNDPGVQDRLLEAAILNVAGPGSG